MAACSSRRRQGEVWQVGSLPVLDGLGLAAAVPHDLGDVLGFTPSALVREKGEFVYGRRRSQEKRWEESSDHKAEHHGQLCRKSATGAREQSVSRRENRQADPSPAPRQLLAGAHTKRCSGSGTRRSASPLQQTVSSELRARSNSRLSTTSYPRTGWKEFAKQKRRHRSLRQVGELADRRNVCV